MKADVLDAPNTFDSVAEVKRAFNELVLPDDDRYWILGGPLTVMVDEIAYIVPDGYTTDGASTKITQAVTAWRWWESPQRWASVFHDWLYQRPGTNRGFADDAYRALLASEGSNRWQRDVMYLAVRLSGGAAFARAQQRGPWVASTT